MKYDVVVVGAGPPDSVCASLLAKEGKRVALVERQRTSAAARWSTGTAATRSGSARTSSRIRATA